MATKTNVKTVKPVKMEKMDDCKSCGHGHQWHNHCGNGPAIYGLGFIGAVIYYLSIATGFWMGVLGVLKSIVWPVFLVYGLLKFIGA
jgi:uncharacterized protein (DUF983 family)